MSCNFIKATPNRIACCDCTGYSVDKKAYIKQDVEERQEAGVYLGVEAGILSFKEVPHPFGTVPGAILPVQYQSIEPVEGSDVLVVSVWLAVDREISGYA